MSDQEKSSHWDLLADDLGAVSAPQGQSPGPSAETASKPREPQGISSKSKMAKQPSSDWGGLVQSLGLEEAVTEVPGSTTEPATQLPTATSVESANSPEGETERADEERPRRRGRRRGRGGRRREQATETEDIDDRIARGLEDFEEGVEFDPPAEPTSDEEPSEEDLSESEDEQAPPRRRRRRRRGGRGDDAPSPDETSQEEMDDGADGEVSDCGERHGRRKAAHRNIPTWDEAIDTIISKNLEARAKEPKRSGRGGRSRSRGPRSRSRSSSEPRET